MERYICIHAHFYQPPRENPWLETVEAQPSAYPFHDWNERITAECYAPNGASRIVDEQGRIIEIVNNYSKISFNFGPTLLSWLDEQSPEVYASILEADRVSQQQFSGHGSAMAQAYNHMILPLANRRDKETQIIWGIRDFEKRFHRKPEGMWLPETAVDIESLDLMAQHGIKFTVLAQHQAAKVRRLGTRAYKDVSGGRVDPTRAYETRLPSGCRMALFFYDGPISRAVAFEKLLNSGEQFAQRLMSGFSEDRDWPQLVNIATDGESYGHHHPHGDMALAYALRYIEENRFARLTNYGEILEKEPPQMEVQIAERTAWSCGHGVERWNSDCGCRSGDSGWNQQWRGPLRAALDWLRDSVNPLFEKEAGRFFPVPWAARNEYINVILNRSQENVGRYFESQSLRPLSPEERVRALKLMEMQRHAMLMYTSCGWFFDEISGIEAVKVLEYAGRAIQLACDLFPNKCTRLESEFLERLTLAKSNIAEHGDGAQIFEKWVRPAMANLRDVGAHYAISSLFERSSDEVPIHCYTVERQDFQTMESGRARVAVGHARVTSKITEESELQTFGVMHFGDHNVNAGVRQFVDDSAYAELVSAVREVFSRADLPEVVRVMDRYFGETSYSLKSLFADERQHILDILLSTTLREAESAYRQIYEGHAPLLQYLTSIGMEKPKILTLTAEFVLNANLQRELRREDLDPVRIRLLLEQAKAEEVSLDRAGLGYTLQKSLGRMMERLRTNPQDVDLLSKVSNAVEVANTLALPVDLWRVQNIYFEIARDYVSGKVQLPPEWGQSFLKLGERLRIRTDNMERIGQLLPAA
ncbi:MAG: glycoside hydrolase family 57 [Acidobacteriaceae bacterium]|nr:glycoside hydrolase family 57 [Acidobacteriaceae bacterium]